MQRRFPQPTKSLLRSVSIQTHDGARIAEIVAATNWQSHTMRGVISGALKKNLALDVTSEKIVNRGRAFKLL